jgi:hypothetical protein
MKTTKTHDERIANMTFACVYPLYVAKVEKKGRTIEELHKITRDRKPQNLTCGPSWMSVRGNRRSYNMTAFLAALPRWENPMPCVLEEPWPQARQAPPRTIGNRLSANRQS